MGACEVRKDSSMVAGGDGRRTTNVDDDAGTISQYARTHGQTVEQTRLCVGVWPFAMSDILRIVDRPAIGTSDIRADPGNGFPMLPRPPSP